MQLEFEGWKVKLALAGLALFVLMAPVACAVKSNKDRAEDWHRRAVVAEESVGGLRAVIVERSRALNRRTLQANRLVSRLHSNRAALRQSKADVGTLTRRQRDLASENSRIQRENSRIQKETRTLETQRASLETFASKLSACIKGLGGALAAGKKARPRAVLADARARAASCKGASANLDAYLGQLR